MGPCLAGCSLSFHQQECERGVGGRVPSSSKLYDWWHHWNCSCIRQQQPAITSRGRQKSKTKEERTRRTLLLVLHTSPETGRARRTDENRIYGKSPGSRVHAGERVGMDVRSINSGACWANSCLTLDELLSYTHTHQPTDPPIERPKAAKRIYIRRTVPILLYILRMYKVDRGGESRRVVSTFLSLFFFLLTFWVLKARKPHKWTPCPYERPTTRRHRSRLILCTTYYHYYYYYYNLLLLRVVLLVVLRKCTLYKQAWKKEGKPVVEGEKKLKSKNMFANDIYTCFWALIGSTTIPVPTDLL